jgi:hypothetical protein
VKARLASLENHRKVQDQNVEHDKRPTLRQRTTADSSKTPGDGSSQGDDRPTLKRRDQD